jgi:hypothetical protein
MYQLKDALQAALTRLHFTASNKDVALPLSEWAAVVGSRYETLLRVVNVVVSNHASDWIDSIANGGLSYREFMALENESLSMYTAQLVEIIGGRYGMIPAQGQTMVTFGEALSTSRIPTKLMRSGLNGDELDVLDVVVSELEEKFKLNTSEKITR